MKSYKKYISFTAGGLAILWMTGHGITPTRNPVDNNSFVVDSAALKKPLWRKFFERRDVIVSLLWLFAGPGATSIQLPGDFNVSSNTTYCVGCGANGANPVTGSQLGVQGGGGGAFVGSGLAIGGLPYNLNGPGGSVNIQVGTGNSALPTIFDVSNNWIIAQGANGQSAGTAVSSSGPSGCVKYDGGNGGAAATVVQNGAGGGGAAGPHGAGSAGSDADSNFTGGAGDAGNTLAQTSGVQFNGQYGPGGGGNGGPNGDISGNAAGNFGAGGGGAGGGPLGIAFGGAGTGGLIAVGYSPLIFITQNFSGSGLLRPTSYAYYVATPSLFSGVGSLRSVASEALPALSQFNGTGGLRIDAFFLGKWPGNGTFAGASQFTVNGLSTKFIFNVPYSGSGGLSASPFLRIGSTPPLLSGAGAFSAVALVNPVRVQPPPTRRWTQHDADSYVQGFNSLLPWGAAWPREPGSVLQKVVKGLMQIWGLNVETEAALLLTQESDPRATTVLLPDWERNFGLPDPCLTPPSTVAARRAALVSRMTFEGGQSKEFFINLAEDLGYEIDIAEFSPFMCGVSRCGDTTVENVAAGGDRTFPRWQIGSPDMRFYWTVSVNNIALTWFRASSGQAGVDPHLRIGVPLDLECILRRYAPAHTIVVFNFSGIDRTNPLAGTGAPAGSLPPPPILTSLLLDETGSHILTSDTSLPVKVDP